MDEVILSRIRQEAYEQGYQDGKVDGYNLAGTQMSSVKQERKKGKWVAHDKYGHLGVHKCSICGERAVRIQSGFRLESDPYDFAGDRGHTTYLWDEFLSNFCPYCGADMRG